ncbi:MAG: polysaccharide deacetylase family protein [Verrucomicrobiota bacterium]
MVIPPASFAGSVAAPYQIGTWEGFRPAAISYTFDDDCPNQYVEAVPMFHAAGLKMTLFTVTSWEGSWSQVQKAAAWGDEIASHTVTHPNLTTVSATQLTNELVNSQSTINSYVTNQSCLTLAYPDCAVPNEAVTAQYYFAARVCSGSLVPKTPSDFLQISSFILGNTGPYTTGASINSLADNAVAANAWCVYLTHAIDGDSGYSPLSSTALQASVNYTSTNQDKFWVETFGNVVRYIQERNASSVAETTNSENSITVQVTNNLNNSIYNYPITLRRPVPANWPAVAVSQNNQPITAKLVTVNSTNYVMFDVVPNGGNIVLSKTVLPFTLSNPVLTPGSLSFRLNGQTGVTYTVCSSADLVSWLPIQSNTLVDTYTSVMVDASKAFQFYRAQWVP